MRTLLLKLFVLALAMLVIAAVAARVARRRGRRLLEVEPPA